MRRKTMGALSNKVEPKGCFCFFGHKPEEALHPRGHNDVWRFGGDKERVPNGAASTTTSTRGNGRVVPGVSLESASSVGQQGRSSKKKNRLGRQASGGLQAPATPPRPNGASARNFSADSTDGDLRGLADANRGAGLANGAASHKQKVFADSASAYHAAGGEPPYPKSSTRSATPPPANGVVAALRRKDSDHSVVSTSGSHSQGSLVYDSAHPSVDSSYGDTQRPSGASDATGYSRAGFKRQPQGPQPLDGNTKYRKIRDLNTGASGFVQLAENTETGEQLAIKFVERGSNHVSKAAEREILNHRMLIMHPSVVHFKEVFLTEKYLCIAMEYMSGGDMAEMVDGYNNRNHRRQSRRGPYIPTECIPEDLSRWFFQQLMVAVEFAHHMGIANRDIKLENALVDNSSAQLPLLKLCDFGYSKDEQAESLCKTICGTPEYIAPEVLIENRYHGTKSDIWSCGVMLYIMLTGDFPFYRPEDEALDGLERMQRMFPRIVRADYAPPPHVSDSCKHLLSCMLTPNPDERITVAGIIGHPWFRTNLPRGVASINELLLQTPLETRVSYCHQSEAEIIGVVGAAHHTMDASKYGSAAEEMAEIMRRAAVGEGRGSFDSMRRTSSRMSVESGGSGNSADRPPVTALRSLSGYSDFSDSVLDGITPSPGPSRVPSGLPRAPSGTSPSPPANGTGSAARPARGPAHGLGRPKPGAARSLSAMSSDGSDAPDPTIRAVLQDAHHKARPGGSRGEAGAAPIAGERAAPAARVLAADKKKDSRKDSEVMSSKVLDQLIKEELKANRVKPKVLE